MAIINLSNDKISSLNTEIGSLDSTLINSYFPELKDIINEIKSNVKNDQINQILGTISSQVDTISGELSTELPKLEDFLTSQMTEYTISESEAETKVNAVLQKMMAFSGMLSKDDGTTISAGTSSSTSSSTVSTSNKGSNLGGKVASGAVTGAVLGGVGVGTGLVAGALVGTKAGAALGAVGGPVGIAIGAAAGAAIGAAAPVIVNAGAKGISLLGKGVTGVGNWLDSIY